MYLNIWSSVYWTFIRQNLTGGRMLWGHTLRVDGLKYFLFWLLPVCRWEVSFRLPPPDAMSLAVMPPLPLWVLPLRTEAKLNSFFCKLCLAMAYHSIRKSTNSTCIKCLLYKNIWQTRKNVKYSETFQIFVFWMINMHSITFKGLLNHF